MKRDLRFEITYPEDIEPVWHAITDPEAIAQWLMVNDFSARVGHRFQFRTDPAPGFDGIVDCEVLIVEQPHKLAYTWAGGGHQTVVTWTLTRAPEGTQVALVQRGFVGFRGLMTSFMLGRGWKSKILGASLPAYLSSIADPDRGTDTP